MIMAPCLVTRSALLASHRAVLPSSVACGPHRLFSTSFSVKTKFQTLTPFPTTQSKTLKPNHECLKSLHTSTPPPTTRSQMLGPEFPDLLPPPLRPPFNEETIYDATLATKPSEEELGQVKKFIQDQWERYTQGARNRGLVLVDDVTKPQQQSSAGAEQTAKSEHSIRTSRSRSDLGGHDKIEVHVIWDTRVIVRFRLPIADPDAIARMRNQLTFIRLIERSTPMVVCHQNVNDASKKTLAASPPLCSPAVTSALNNNNGEGTFAYVLDTWGGAPDPRNMFINDLGDRVKTIDDADFTDSLSGQHDYLGHGSVVSALIGGDTYGVANKTTIIPVKVIEDNGKGDPLEIEKALRLVLKHAKSSGNISRSVVNLSVSTFVKGMNDTIDRLSREGLFCVVASGNYALDTSWVSPASAATAFTVGAIDKDHNEATYSNAGTHVAIFSSGDTDYYDPRENQQKSESGTSFAAPRVAGLALRILSGQPQGHVLGLQKLRERILDFAEDGFVKLRSKSTKVARLEGHTKKV